MIKIFKSLFKRRIKRMHCVISEAPDVPPPRTRQTSRHTNLIIRSRLTYKHSGVTLVHTWFGQIHPDASLIALLSFKTHHLHETLFVISSFKEEPAAEGSPRLRLRRRPRSGPPSPAPSYQAFPRPPSAEWPGGCPTPAPSSPRSSATRETEYTQCVRRAAELSG